MGDLQWIPTREAALERLDEFVPRAGSAYRSERNYDLGPDRRENVSMLSPYVRRRMVTEQEVVSAVLQAHSARAAEKFIQEVFWRTYWKGWLELRPAVWSDYLADVRHATGCLGQDPELRRRYSEALEARTGIACFDAWAEELVDVGYLHNHARMWFASIWIFTLRLPWVLGAEFFYRHLLDADPASNTLSWRWVAGLHTRGKHYVARASNICKYTRGRFDPRGDLDESPDPLRDERTYAIEPLPASDGLTVGPATGLLMTVCDLQGLPDPPLPVPVSAIAFLPPAGEGRHAPMAVDFSRAAIDDSARRISRSLGAPCDAGITTAGQVVEWASRHSLEQLAVLDPGVGEATALLESLEPVLRSNGIRLVRLRRPWDALLFPAATAGFFKFKKKIPRVVEKVRARPAG